MRVVDRRAACDDRRHRTVGAEQRQLVVVHRFGGARLPHIYSAAGIAAWYRDNQEWTGGQMPYHFVILRDGTVEQALDLSDVGPHARRWNVPGLGVAAIGDFREHPPTLDQMAAAKALTAGLVAWIGRGPYDAILGHDELPGGSSDPEKRCPGVHWDMGDFRTAVALEVARLRCVLNEPNAELRRELYLGMLGVML